MKLYTNSKTSSMYSGGRHMWQSVPFKHPSTFDTLAMEPDSIARIKGDLKSFMEGKDFFERVGRAWKRGYLLYGPPGTGKSSMIAAMANFLKYDVYDLELTQVICGSFKIFYLMLPLDLVLCSSKGVRSALSCGYLNSLSKTCKWVVSCKAC
jgi:hypothetical protein